METDQCIGDVFRSPHTITVVVVFVSYFYSIVISLAHFRVIIGLFKFKFQYSMHFYFRTTSNRTQSVYTINSEANIYYADGNKRSKWELNH